jgi:hypothetical protein
MSTFESAPLNPAGSWPDVPALTTEAPLLGGLGGPLNAQAQALAARTVLMKAALDAIAANQGALQVGDAVMRAGTMTELRTTPPPTKDTAVVLEGSTTAGDGFGGIFYWDQFSTLTDDGGVTVVRPNSIPAGQAGRWRRASQLGDNQASAALRADLASPAAGKGANLIEYNGTTVEAELASLRQDIGGGGGSSPGVSSQLSSPACTLPADPAGNVSSYIGASTTVTITRNGANETDWTITKADGLGVTSTLSGGTVTITSLAAGIDGTYVDITATKTGQPTQNLRYIVAKARSGSNGLTRVPLSIYQRAASAPAKPSSTATYVFATGALTGLNNGWLTAIPAGDLPLWACAATAASDVSSDTIAGSEWTDPVQIGRNGSTVASVLIYQRTGSASAPAAPSANVTYTVSTSMATGMNNGWLASIPSSGGSYLWSAQATALTTGDTDTIAPGEWAVGLLSQDGAAGATGNYTDFIFIRSASQPATPTGAGTPSGWSDAPPAGANPLWMSTVEKTAAGTLVGSWSVPSRADGDGISVEYSVDGVNAWHTTFATGDKYRRERIGLGAWSAAIKIVGEDGQSAPLLFLSTTAQAFTYGSNGAALPAGQTITFTANRQNLAGTVTWAARLFNSSGTDIGAASLGGSGDVRTLSVANFGSAQFVNVTASIGGLSDTATCVRLRDGASGADAIVSDLSNDSHIVPADSNGNVTSFAGASTGLNVFAGLVNDTANWSFSKADSLGITSTISGNTVTITAMDANTDAAYVDITATRSGYPTQTKRFTVTKSRSAQGTTGFQAGHYAGVYASKSSGTATATAKVKADGRILGQINLGATYEATRWYSTLGSAPALYVKATKKSGTASVSGSALGTIYAVSSEPSWTTTKSSTEGLVDASLLLTYYTDPGGTTVQGVGSIDIVAEIAF